MTRDAVAALENCKARAAIVAVGCDAPLDRFDAVITVERPRVALAILTNLFARPIALMLKSTPPRSLPRMPRSPRASVLVRSPSWDRVRASAAAR